MANYINVILGAEALLNTMLTQKSGLNEILLSHSISVYTAKKNPAWSVVSWDTFPFQMFVR